MPLVFTLNSLPLIMEKFIAAMRDLKKRPQKLNCRLVWNPHGKSFQNNSWLVTTTFSISFIEKMGLEFIYEKKLIAE